MSPMERHEDHAQLFEPQVSGAWLKLELGATIPTLKMELGEGGDIFGIPFVVPFSL